LKILNLSFNCLACFKTVRNKKHTLSRFISKSQKSLLCKIGQLSRWLNDMKEKAGFEKCKHKARRTYVSNFKKELSLSVSLSLSLSLSLLYSVSLRKFVEHLSPT
jgi:hypothetical protein